MKPKSGGLPSRTIITPTIANDLLKILLEKPEGQLDEAYEDFCAQHDLDVHYSTVLRAVASWASRARGCVASRENGTRLRH